MVRNYPAYFDFGERVLKALRVKSLRIETIILIMLPNYVEYNEQVI